MIVFRIFDDDPLPCRRFIYGQNPRFAFVQSSSCTWPINSAADLFIFGECEITHFQFSAATTSLYVQHLWNV